ncbi:MAG TPA: crosslink repair DNA glycosylase YcaQ family protein [Solirubrobacteraceae bacterium]|nr:crosslink repair DNA glycosylase YcaQ family protein [Solirubrobacteraceae bacterium]
MLLAAFDTLMLGYRTRQPFVAAQDDHHILGGGGMLKPVVLVDGLATGTWSIRNGRPVPSWFGRPAPAAALESEAGDIERFLAS